MPDRVTYAEVRAVAEAARKQFPDATRVNGQWYGGEAYAEVWFGRRAITWRPDSNVTGLVYA